MFAGKTGEWRVKDRRPVIDESRIGDKHSVNLFAINSLNEKAMCLRLPIVTGRFVSAAQTNKLTLANKFIIKVTKLLNELSCSRIAGNRRFFVGNCLLDVRIV